MDTYSLVLLQGVADRNDAWFLGWFGAIGIAALHFANESFRQTGYELPWVLGTLIIVASVVAHGAMGTPLTRRYGPARFKAGSEEDDPV